MNKKILYTLITVIVLVLGALAYTQGGKIFKGQLGAEELDISVTINTVEATKDKISLVYTLKNEGNTILVDDKNFETKIEMGGKTLISRQWNVSKTATFRPGEKAEYHVTIPGEKYAEVLGETKTLIVEISGLNQDLNKENNKAVKEVVFE